MNLLHLFLQHTDNAVFHVITEELGRLKEQTTSRSYSLMMVVHTHIFIQFLCSPSIRGGRASVFSLQQASLLLIALSLSLALFMLRSPSEAAPHWSTNEQEEAASAHTSPTS